MPLTLEDALMIAGLSLEEYSRLTLRKRRELLKKADDVAKDALARVEIVRRKREAARALCNHVTENGDNTVDFCLKEKGHEGNHRPGGTRAL